MRAAGITALGEAVEIFELDELAPPAAGEVLIDVVAAGIGNWDDLVRIGSWQIGGPPPIGARDVGVRGGGSGRLGRCRPARRRRGDDTSAAARRHGTWADKVLAPAAAVAARPPEVSWEACGAFPIPALTPRRHSTRLLESRAAAGSSSTAPAGVTGGLLVQLAAARGARVIATASAKKVERIRGYGASEVLDYHGDWPALVREITGGGAPKAVNAAPGQSASTLKAVADGAASPRSRATRRGRNGASPSPTSTSGLMLGSLRLSRSCWPGAPSACRSRPSVRSKRRQKR